MVTLLTRYEKRLEKLFLSEACNKCFSDTSVSIIVRGAIKYGYENNCILNKPLILKKAKLLFIQNKIS